MMSERIVKNTGVAFGGLDGGKEFLLSLKEKLAEQLGLTFEKNTFFQVSGKKKAKVPVFRIMAGDNYLNTVIFVVERSSYVERIEDLDLIELV